MAPEGRLRFEASREARDKADGILERMRAGQLVGELLPREYNCEGKFAGLSPVVIFSDFEPDDLMAIAQIWRWSAEQAGVADERPVKKPVIIMCADFKKKDGRSVFEKKLLLARLLLGLEPYRDFHVLTTADVQFHDGTTHPLGRGCFDQCDAAIGSAAAEIAELTAEGAEAAPRVDVYILAPGHGHLDALRRRLGARESPASAWSRLCGAARVVTYTGSFNTRGHTREDLAAMCELSAAEPLVDVSKFVFFGRDKAHPETASFDTFASPELAPRISARSPLLAAAFEAFAEEFNGDLIHPGNTKLFAAKGGGDARTDEEQERFQASIAGLFERDGLRAYARALVSDEALFAKVVRFKQSTVRACANGTADMPLCDQACFLYVWLQQQPASQEVVLSETGEWWVDPVTGFSGAGSGSSEHSLPAQARQPRMAEPQDEALLEAMKNALERYVLCHLELVSPPPAEAGAA